MIDREKIKATLTQVETQTNVKAWMFQVAKKFYQMVPYSITGMGDFTGVWESNSKGKRKGKDLLFRIEKKDVNLCLEKFLDTLDQPVSA